MKKISCPRHKHRRVRQVFWRKLSVFSFQRKKAILLVTSYLLLVTLLGGCAKREIRNIDSKGKNIICFGNSITFGYGAEPGEDYPSVLSKMTDIPVVNVGIDGDTSIEGLKRMYADVLDREPLLVIIEFGGNDFLRKIPQKLTMDNIREMVDSIQAQGAMVAVVDISTGVLLDEYHRSFYKLAREKGAIFIPRLLDGIISNPNLKSDFLHPNSSGYKVIAERIHRVIQPYLDKNIAVKKSINLSTSP